MKKSILMGLGVCALALGGVAALVGQKGAVETKAEGHKYYLCGSMNSWNDKDQSLEFVEGVPKSYTFASGAQFKFRYNETGWNDSNDLNKDMLRGTSYGYFGAGEDSNFRCNYGGTYKVLIQDNCAFIDLVESAATVYAQINYGGADAYLYAYDNTTHPYDEGTGFGGKLEPLGAWPGTKITDITSATDFKKRNAVDDLWTLGGIGKVTVPFLTGYSTNMKLVVTKGDSTKSPDQDLHDGYYYTNWLSEGIEDAGVAAKAVHAIDKAINAADSSSLCNISQEDATTLLGLVPASGSARTVWFEESTIYTLPDRELGGENKNWTYSAVYSKLYKIANPSSSARIDLPSAQSSSSAWLITGSVLVSSLLSIGGLLLFRRKKAE